MILASVSGIFALIRQLQMLQQNSYFPSRYLGWIRDSYSYNLALDSVLFCVCSVLYALENYSLQLIFIGAVLLVRVPLAIRTQQQSIKKLVFTARVKRLISAAAGVFVLLCALYLLMPALYLGKISNMLLFMLSFVAPITTLLVWCITNPVEKAVGIYYIKDAKRILKEHKGLIVIGVTGSYGKTGTKFILQRILSEKFNVAATPQSFNTPMGVVRAIRENLQPSDRIFICEMGAKNIGDIREICDIVNPDYGLITSVGPQHLETFKTVDNVFKTKFELAEAVKQKGGAVFVNGDSEGIRNRINLKDFRVYGTDKNNEFYAENISYGRDGCSFDLCLAGERIHLSSKLLGLHSVLNIAGAAALARTLGVTPEEIRFAVSALKPTEHRLELKPFKNGSLLIDDAYNANPEGCIEAVRVLKSFEGYKKIIITPGLIELGSREYSCNYDLGLEAAGVCDIIILVGRERSKPMREAAESAGFDMGNLHIVSSFAEAMQVCLPMTDSKTVVLIENDLPDNYLK